MRSQSPMVAKHFGLLLNQFRKISIPRNFPPTSNPSCNLACEPHTKAESFISSIVCNSTLPRYPTPSSTYGFINHPFARLINITKIRKVQRYLDLRKPPGFEGIQPFVRRMFPPELVLLIHRIL